MDTESMSESGMMNTSGSLTGGDRVISVKSSLTGIGWREQYLPILEQFVNTVSITTNHTYSFSKFIFLHELDNDADFDMASYINKDFFSKVWLALIDYTRKRARAAKTVMYRTLIARHLGAYLTAASYQRPQLLHSQQSALIECQKIYVCYSNNIQMRFGNHLRRVINVMLNVRQRKENLQRVLTTRGITENQIRDQIVDVVQPAKLIA